MRTSKPSPISVEIIARSGNKFFRLKIVIPVTLVAVLISAVSKLLG